MVPIVVRAGLVTLLAGCVVEPRPVVPLPTPDGSLRAEIVARLGAETGLRDVRNLMVSGETLLVADAGGLFVFGLTDPGAPVLLSKVAPGPVDKVAARDGRAYTIDVAGSDRLRAFDISAPTAPVETASLPAITRTFGGLAARPGLLWHAVGSSPPSRIYFGDPIDRSASCAAPDRERGAMDVWLAGDRAFQSVHFDDYAGDGFDGNGGFGLAILDIDSDGGTCPRVSVADVVLAPTHSLNRSRHERPSNSDLQVDYDADRSVLYMTGEQRLRLLAIDAGGHAAEMARLDLPEVLDVAIRPEGGGAVAGLANGDFLLVDARLPDHPSLSAVVATSGIARSVAASGTSPHFYVGDSEGGVLVVRYLEPSP